MKLQGSSQSLQKTLAEFHRERWAPLLGPLSSTHQGNSLLALGPSGSGVLETLQTLYQALHCRRVTDSLPCFECATCVRISEGRWPDLHWTSDPEQSESIGVEAVRDLKSKSGFGPSEPGAQHWAIIPQADMLTAQASNALLKILEEPPRGWRLILVAPDESTILPTLVSRCLRVRFSPLTESVVLQALVDQGVSHDRARTASRLAQGSLARARLFASDDLWSKRELLLKFLTAPQAHHAALIEWASGDGVALELLIDQIEMVTRDLLEWSCGEPLAPSDSQAVLKAVCDRSVRILGLERFRDRLFRISDSLANQRRDLSTPLNRKLVAQNILAPWVL